ncbi:MAG: hypothetical protein ACREK8_05655 [Gemmatimonadales bacterium]
MLHSVLAVVAGFLVMAIIVMVGTALAVRFVLHVPIAAMQSPAPVLSRAYLATNLSTSAIAAVAGGFTAAWIAGHDQLIHGLALAGVMIAMSIVSMRQAAGRQPRWYQAILVVLMPVLAVGGAAWCAALAQTTR